MIINLQKGEYTALIIGNIYGTLKKAKDILNRIVSS